MGSGIAGPVSCSLQRYARSSRYKSNSDIYSCFSTVLGQMGTCARLREKKQLSGTICRDRIWVRVRIQWADVGTDRILWARFGVESSTDYNLHCNFIVCLRLMYTSV